MSSFFDIVIAFVAALIAAAFAHFGASDIPESRANPSSAPEAAAQAPTVATPVATEAKPVMTPVSAPQPPAPPEPDLATQTAVDAAAIEAEHMAAIAAHEAEMRAHEAQMRAYEAIIKATENAAAHARIISHLSDAEPVSDITLELMARQLAHSHTTECTEPETATQPALTAQADTAISMSL